eukprot:scaffold107138_cov38-Cyclotella_meneghiniana.AAC.2
MVVILNKTSHSLFCYSITAINNAAVAAASSVSVAGQAFDPSRSRSAHEASLELTNVAAKNQKAHHVTVKQARNMDDVALCDYLSGALTSSTLEFAIAMKMFAPSPSTKGIRSTQNNQQQINLVIQEIKGLMERQLHCTERKFSYFMFYVNF